MSIPTLVAQARVMAARTLTDTITISRETGDTTTDELGTETAAVVDVWAGPGLVQRDNNNRLVVAESAGIHVDAASYVVKVAIETPIETGDLVTVTASLDPTHVGRRWRILETPTQGWSVLRRCPADPAR